MGQRRQATTVEVEPSGTTWRKSSASGGNNTSCVELARFGDAVCIRCSRNRRGGRLTVSQRAWTSILAYLGSNRRRDEPA